ncbi:MAG: glycosyltransferase family 2 protein [Hyphomicrobiaceae bacterium]|nr:glycosyltransferase family 2 protein [Hyphomicrobiaceae bacterium]
MELPLSVLIRTLNEEDRIEKTITSVLTLGAEIVVIDAGSKDGTVSIAKRMGAQVYFNPWPGFGPQRQFGEQKCTRRFVFSLDADEVVTPELSTAIQTTLSQTNPPQLIVVRKAWVHPHHAKPTAFAFAHEQILIYDKNVARTGSNPNWDKLEISIDESPIKLRPPLWHYSLRDLNHAVTKAVFVAQLAADTQKPRSRSGLLLRLPFEFPFSFLKAYVLRRYFIAGADGFNMAMSFAIGRYLRIAMMLERLDYGARKSK